MNLQEKERAQKFITQNLKGIEAVISGAVKSKDEYRANVRKYTVEGQEYTQDYKEKVLQDLKNKFAVRLQGIYQDILSRLDQLKNLIHDRDSVLDLNNPALSAALILIDAIGEKMTFEQAVKINANFLHDQSALSAIQAAYKAKGMDNPGNIQAWIYNADSVIESLKRSAYESFMQDGSINYFAVAVNKLATLEGTTIEAAPDQQGVTDAIRAAAGLPVA